MIDWQTIEMTLLQIARQNGDPLDGYALYTIRTGVAQRYRQRNVTDRK